MSKYIIEIPDDVQYVLLNGKADNKYYTAVRPIAELEILNSDYINEHFGELQDEAYKRGYADAERIWRAPSSDNEFYQKGFEDGKKYLANGCVGCQYEGDESRVNPCCECARVCDDHYIPKNSDCIEVGDEVTHKSDSAVWKAVCIRIDGDRQHMNLMGYTGAVGYYPVDDFKKTGKHYDIASILEAMRTHD